MYKYFKIIYYKKNMFINKRLSIKFNIDKLHIKFSNYDLLRDAINDVISDSFDGFRFIPIHPHLNYRMYELRYDDEVLGVLSFRESHGVILEVDNRQLYSGSLYKVYLFAHRFSLTMETFSKIDICCDANVDLPGKLNRLLHSRAYEITRRGVKMLNYKGNIDIGVKILPNIVTVDGERERRYPTYNFTPVVTSGCRKCPVRMVGYNKSVEVEKSSHKHYILRSLPFGDDVAHRLEIRTCGYEMQRNGLDVRTLFYDIDKEETVRNLFIAYLDRFFEFNKGGQRYRASELLRVA